MLWYFLAACFPKGAYIRYEMLATCIGFDKASEEDQVEEREKHSPLGIADILRCPVDACHRRRIHKHTPRYTGSESIRIYVEHFAVNTIIYTGKPQPSDSQAKCSNKLYNRPYFHQEEKHPSVALNK